MNKAVARIPATREQVFATLTKYPDYPLWVPDCRRLTVLASSGNQTDVEVVLVAMKTVTAVLRFQADPPASLRFEMIQGTAFRSYSGEHRLLVPAAGGGTVVMTEIEIDAGFLVPRILLHDRIERFLQEFGRGLEKRVAITATPSSRTAGPPHAPHRAPTRRLLRITRTTTGMQIWYMGRTP